MLGNSPDCCETGPTAVKQARRFCKLLKLSPMALKLAPMVSQFVKIITDDFKASYNCSATCQTFHMHAHLWRLARLSYVCALVLQLFECHAANIGTELQLVHKLHGPVSCGLTYLNHLHIHVGHILMYGWSQLILALW